ncbi:MAG: hypothetical protein CMJ36_05440 [Phycisphaerae bacterium]|nr:hypothetical protein [Phycisphaerae bacterium]
MKSTMSMLTAFVVALPAFISGLVQADEKTQPATLRVVGVAELKIPADQLQLDLGIEASATSPKEANAQAVKAMQDLIKAVEGLGLKEREEYVIERYTINPQWSPRPRNPAPEWRPTIVGYKVSSTMRITTERLEMGGDLIATAIDAGANDIGQLVFGLADPRTQKAAAIRQATKNALTDASTLAEAGGVSLMKIKSLSLDSASSEPRYQYEKMYTGARMAMDAAPAPPIVSGDVTVRASVSLVWEIEGP